jgi:predicted PurR-regulated permease PerM
MPDPSLRDPPGAVEPPVRDTVPARDPFLTRFVTAVGVVATAALLATLVILGIDIFLAAFGGILLAVLLRAATGLLARYTLVPERWAYTALLLLLAALVVGGGLLLGPFAQQQVEGAMEQVPEIVADVEEYLQERGWGRWLLDTVLGNGGDGLAEGAAGMAGGIFSVFTDWFYYFLAAFFVGLFAAARPELYVHGIANLFPLRKRERILHLLDELGHTLRWWLVGQAMAMILIGVSTWIMLWIFGVPLAPLLGLLVGLLGFVPYMGPIVGLVPVAITAGTQGVETLMYVLGAYTAVQMIEGYVVTPLIQHRMVYLPPVFTIIAQIVMGVLLGALGFILATPLAAVVLVVSRFYREDVLGEPGVVEAGRKR